MANQGKTISYGGEVLELTKAYPAMVREEPHDVSQCRTVYEDQNGEFWCMWYGRYCKVELQTFNNWPSDGMQKSMWIVDTTKHA